MKMGRFGKAVARAAIAGTLAFTGATGIVATQALAPSEAGTVQHAQAKASKAAVKWLKGTWTTGSRGIYGKGYKVKFTQTFRKTYAYNGKRWKFVGKDKIKKTKKTKKGYNVYLENGGVYKASSKKQLDSFWYSNDGTLNYSGGSSLFR